MGGKIIQAHVYISGRVQGVFFRLWTVRQADDLNLKGWVKNTREGKVEAVFQGSEDKVNKMIQKCRKGSKFSKVTGIRVDWEEISEVFESFEITPSPS